MSDWTWDKIADKKCCELPAGTTVQIPCESFGGSTGWHSPITVPPDDGFAAWWLNLPEGPEEFRYLKNDEDGKMLCTEGIAKICWQAAQAAQEKRDD